jgi:hypothetical protein
MLRIAASQSNDLAWDLSHAMIIGGATGQVPFRKYRLLNWRGVQDDPVQYPDKEASIDPTTILEF